MSKKRKQFSRTEPTKAKPSVAPAGTPVAPEAPAADAKATGDYSYIPAPLEIPPPVPPADDVVSAIEPELKAALAGDKAAQEKVHKTMEETMPRRGGAGWFIPPQGPSGFGVKE